MILSALRLFGSLSGYHHRTIILTVLLPAIGPPTIAYFRPDWLVLRFVLYITAFLVWSVFAVLAVASMLKRDSSEAEQLVSQKVEALSGQISRLGEEQEASRVGFQQQMENLEEAVRSTLKEGGGRPSASDRLHTRQDYGRQLKDIRHIDCRRGEQGGASSTMVRTRNASAMGGGLREAGGQLGYWASIGRSRILIV